MSGVPDGEKSYHAWLRRLEGYEGQIAAASFYPPRAAQLSDYDGEFALWLRRLGIRPYSHQAQGFEELERGSNLVVATPTASGKSLIYSVPALAAVEGGGTAIYLAPTKALSHDQLDSLREMASTAGLQDRVGVYDGDTPRRERSVVRSRARLLLSNPDMLHYGILPYHQQWAHYLGSLRYLVLDELHSYRGVLGIHVANIVRRLLRLARHYGARPQVVAASATIGNPTEHAYRITGLPFVPIVQDGAAQGPRELLFWEPPLVAGSDGRRRSPNTESAWLAARFVRSGLRSIFFCNSRRSAELLRRYTAGQLEPGELSLVQSYRAGYTAEDRRLIEQGFRNGDIRVLTATSALELGVDVGDVDAVVLVGYPGSHMALWQRSGRAGRSGGRALTVLVPGNDPLDEYYLRHPDLILEGRVESAVADPHNEEIHPLHVECAAAELPLEPEDGFVGPGVDLAAMPRLYRSGGRWAHAGRYPHRKVRIRGSGGSRVLLRDGVGRLLGESDPAAALRDLHPGAVYLHMGETYLVAKLDLEGGEAILLPHIEDFYTQARSETDIDILAEYERHGRVGVGRVRVTNRVTGYVRKRYITEAVLDERPLDLPEQAYSTQAMWFAASDVAAAVAEAELPGALHALEHTLISLLPAFVLCERADIGGVSYPAFPSTGEPSIFIYDGHPGGVGYVRAGAARFSRWLQAARDLLADCPCKAGCPRCVLSPKCGNGNRYLDKDAARRLADALLAREEEPTVLTA